MTGRRWQASSRSRMRQVRAALLSWARSNLRDFPWRGHLGEPYPVLLAELLLKRTTARAAARVYDKFLSEYPTLLRLAAASSEQLEHELEPLGLQTQRSKRIAELAAQLRKRGTIPKRLATLLNVPGLGPYSARAVLSFGHGIPAAVVDSNVARVLARTFHGVDYEDPNNPQLQELADRALAKKAHQTFNLALLDLGATVCTATRPRHESCPLNTCCAYYISGAPNARAEATSRVREVRAEYRVGQAALAKKAGISKRTLVNLEAMRTRPTERTLEKLATALDVPVEVIRDRQIPARPA